jgi:hypothetical protein
VEYSQVEQTVKLTKKLYFTKELKFIYNVKNPFKAAAQEMTSIILQQQPNSARFTENEFHDADRSNEFRKWLTLTIASCHTKIN